LGQLITTENANGVWQHVTFKFFEAGKMLQWFCSSWGACFRSCHELQSYGMFIQWWKWEIDLPIWNRLLNWLKKSAYVRRMIVQEVETRWKFSPGFIGREKIFKCCFC
jgi:hypothetical protein